MIWLQGRTLLLGLVFAAGGACTGEAIRGSSTTTAAAQNEVDWAHQIAYQRGIEAVNWAMPAVSMLAMRDASFSLGGGYNTIYWLSEVPTALQEALTANNQTPYASAYLSTRDGPTVLEIPPASQRTAIFGSAVDVFQVPVADIGPAGTDKGAGGRYLFLPPGYDGTVPDGFLPVQLDLYDVYVALRCIPLGDATFAEAAEYSKRINAYPLSEAAAPPPGRYVDIAGKHLPTLPEFDLTFFERIARLVNEEPLLERDKVMGGMLASIGIERGRAFEPAGVVREALEQAARDGKTYLDYTFHTAGYSTETYWPGRQWQWPKQPSEEGFVFDEGEYLLLDARGSLFHWATFFPRNLGRASAYLLTMRDEKGDLLSGGGRYRLRVPAGVPARDFWSVIAYSMDTKAFIYNDLGRVGLSSYDTSSMNLNDDGSVDIILGETPPEGVESNWIPTAGEDFFLLFRLYGPEEPFFDKSFVLPDVERVN